MKEFLRLVYSECYKMRHTLFFKLHLLIPIFGILLFLCYYGVSPHEWESEVSGYIMALGAALPFVAGIVCALSVSQEEGNHFLVVLGAPAKRQTQVLAKWSVLFFTGFMSWALAVGGFMAGYSLVLKRGRADFGLVLALILLLWTSSAGIYFFHLFLNFWRPKSISIGIGAFESVVSALMLTGLGEGRWQFLPCAYGGRWAGFCLRYYLEGFRPETEAIKRLALINAAVTAGIFLFTMAGFHFYEGRRTYD